MVFTRSKLDEILLDNDLKKRDYRYVHKIKEITKKNLQNGSLKNHKQFYEIKLI